MAVDYAKLAAQAEQETKAAPAQDYAKLAEQAETEANAPAPLTGAIPGGAGVPQPSALADTPEENNRAALQSGLIGAGKSIPQTVADVGGLVNKIPRLGEHIAPSAEVKKFSDAAQADNPQEEAGKVAGAAVQSVIPVDRALEALPNAERAGRTLQSIAMDAIHEPVNLGRTVTPLSRVQQLADRGSSMPGVVRKLGQRVQQGTMQYPEARDFYSNLAAPSFWEKMTTSPTAKREIAKMAAGFRQDIGDAATRVGRGQDYDQALNEYRNAKRLQKLGLTLGGAGATYGAKAAGIGAGLGLIKKLGLGE